MLESLEKRMLLASDWQNPRTALDVDNDGVVAPLDALAVINRLNSLTAPILPPAPAAPPPFFDTDGDGALSPIDVLLVINALNGDRDPPALQASLAIDTAPSGGVNTDGVTFNSRIVGTVTDLTGIQSLVAQIDGGVPVAVAIASGGSFAFEPAFVADGDGAHVVSFVARDGVGNLTPPLNVAFVLDTVDPTTSDFGLAPESDSPPTGDRRTESAQVNLVGTTEPGASVTLLQNGAGVNADANGRFTFGNVALTLGENQFMVRVDDIAGNTSTALVTITRDEGGQPNRPPELAPVESIEIQPGEVRTFQLQAGDPDGDKVTFSIRGADLPGLRLGANGLVTLYPAPEQIGTHFAELIASDGRLETTQSVRIDVVADPITTTRVRGRVADIQGSPIPGVRVQIGTAETLTANDGSFTLAATQAEFDSDVLIVRGDDFAGPVHYPFLPTRMSFLLPGGRQTPIPGVQNTVRDIVLPIIDPANGLTFDPQVSSTLQPPNIPGASLTIPASSLDFDGPLIISEIPLELPPPNLPTNFAPDGIINVFPNNLEFSRPAPLNLPNRGGYAPGTSMLLFGLDPNRGEFDEVGKAEVSQDGRTIVTTTGGLRRTSWHFFVVERSKQPPAEDPETNRSNKRDKCDDCQERKESGASEIALHTGGLEESHSLVAYQSLGEVRSLQLRYDSLRADPRPIIHFAFTNVAASPADRLVASMSYANEGVITDVPGFDPAVHGAVPGLVGGEHLWKVPTAGIAARIDAALQADLTNQPSGLYRFRVQTGIRRGGDVLAGVDDVFFRDEIVVNRRASIFGAGWDLAGWQEIVPDDDDGALLIDGDGEDLLFAPGATSGAFVSPPGDFSVLERSGDGTFRRTTRERTVYQFDAANRLASVVDRNGNTTTYEYDAVGRLVAWIDPVGLRTSLAYGGGDKVSSITDPAGRVTLLAHDASGNLVRITDPDGSSRLFTYDSSHRMTGETDQLGREEQEGYGFHGRILSVRRKDGVEQFFGPVSVRNLLPVAQTSDPTSPPSLGVSLNVAQAIHVDPNGNIVTEVLDGDGLPVTTTDAAGPQPIVERDANRLPIRVTDPRGNVVTFAYDGRGNVTRIDNGTGVAIENTGTLFANEGLSARARGAFVALEDLDGDGDLDAVGTHNDATISNNTVGVYLNSGDGTFGPRADVGTGGNDPLRVLLTDVNADGKRDLVVVNRASNNMAVRLGNGDGTFGGVSTFTVGNGPQDVALADLDGDGDLDAVTANSPGGGLTVLLNDGIGGFAGRRDFATGNLDGLVLADFTGDGRIDVAAVSGTGVRLLVGNGDGTLAASATLHAYPGASAGRQLASADVDRDGDADLVATIETASSGSGFVVLVNDGVGNFAAARNLFFDLGQPHEDLLLRDFDQDQEIDVLLAAQGADAVHLFRGVGDGTFEARLSFEIGAEPGGLAAGDLNGDGDLDVVAASRNSQNLLRLDGVRGGAFAQAALERPSTEPKVVAMFDANGDGALDIVAMLQGSPGGFAGDSITVFPGDGTGRFGDGIDTAITDRVQRIVSASVLRSADVNGDGILDLVSPRRDRVDIDIGRGDGTFSIQPPLVMASSAAATLELGDLDGDGDADIVVHQANRVSVFLNQGQGTFGARQDISVTTRAILGDSSLRLADVTGDGALDVVTIRNASAVILPGAGDGGFGAAVQINTGAGSGVDFVAVGDLDGDGDSDIVTLSGGQSRLTVLRSRGDGTFDAPVAFDGGRDPRALDLVDLDNDGRLDAVMSSSSGDVLTVLRGVGDGRFAARREYAVGSGPARQAFGDIEGDGDLDVVTVGLTERKLSILRNQAVTQARSGPGAKLFAYDPVFNQLVAAVNEVGQETRYVLDGQGNVAAAHQIVGAVGGADDLVTIFSYDARGQILTETDPLGRVQRFTYDALGRRLTKTVASGTADEATLRYEYDSVGNVTALVDALGNRTEYEYDLMNRKVVERDALGRETLFEYDARGNEIRRIDRRNNAYSFTYDSQDRLVRRTDPLGNVSVTEYDANGNVVADADATGAIYRTTYDARDRRVATTDPLGRVTRNVYDAADNLVERIDPLGNVTRFLYDGVNRSTTVIDALGGHTSTVFDGAGQVVAQVDPLGRTSRVAYDDVGRMVRFVDPAGGVTRYEYDRAGNLIRQVDALGFATTYAYNARNEPLSVTDAVGGTTRYVRNALGLMTALIDANGGVTAYAYDPLYREVARTDALGGVATRQYDAEGDIVAMTDASGGRTHFVLNALGQPILRTDELGGQIASTFDATGRVATVTDQLGRAFVYRRDALGRVTEQVDPLGASTLFEYDANGNLIREVDPLDHVTRFEFDALNRQVRVVDSMGGATRYEYDLNGNLVAVTDRNDRRRASEYDERNQLVRTVDALGQATVYTYDSLGRQIRVTDPLGRSTQREFDGVGRLTRTTDPAGQSELSAYDAVGNLMSFADALGRVTQYEYDAVNRRTSSTDAAGNTATFEFDIAGNLVGVTDELGRKTEFAYDALHRRIGSTDALGGRIEYQYDAAGQRVRTVDELGRATQFAYDPNGRVTSVIDAAGQSTVREYDEGGRLVAQVDARGNRTTYEYDALDRLLASIDPLGDALRYEYDFEGNLLATTDRRGHVTRHQYDALHRSVATIDAAGGVSATRYDAAGQVVSLTDPLGRATQFLYDVTGRLRSMTDAAGAVTTFTYDAVGNQLSTVDALGRTTSFTYDARNREIRVTDASGGVVETAYDAIGNVTGVRDANGNLTTFEYDLLNRPTRTIDALGGVTRAQFDAAGQTVALVDALNREIAFVYDAVGRTTSIIDAAGFATSTEYDANGNLVASIDALGRRTEFAYDARDRLVRTTDALDGQTQFQYDASNNLIAVTDRRGHVARTEFDALNRPVKSIDALAGERTTAYDAAGQVIAIVDQLGRMTSFEYDLRGRLTRTTDALGRVTSNAYDAVGNRVSTTDALGRVTTYVYDDLDRRVRVADPLGQETRFAYDAVGNTRVVTDPSGNVTTTTYDALNRPIASMDPLGGIRANRYDAAGQLAATVDPLGRVTAYEYDSRGNRTRATDPSGNSTTFAFDPVSALVGVTDALGHQSRYEYDALNRRVKWIDARGDETRFAYDAGGNLTRLTDASGNDTAFAYDPLNRLTAETNALGATRQFRYDAAGNRTQRIDRNGRAITFVYDAVDRLVEERWLATDGGAPVHAIEIDYDAAGQTHSLADAFASYTFAYDLAGRLTSVSNAGTPGVPTVLQQYAFNGAGDVSRYAESIGGVPGAVVDYQYDALRRVSRVAQSGVNVAEKRADYAYNIAGEVTEIQRFADLDGGTPIAATTYAYDAGGRPTQVRHRATAEINVFDYGYDASNRIVSVAHADGATAVGYDAINQVVSVDYSFQTDDQFAYDATGNRTAPDATSGVDNRLLADGTFDYVHDAEGNLIRRTDRTTGEISEFTYDHRNRLTSVTRLAAGGAVTSRATYAYDAFNRRVETSVDADGAGPTAPVTTRFVYDGDQIALTFDGAGNLTRRVLSGPGIDQILAEETGTDVWWSLTDIQGSVVDVLNANGEAVNHLTYGAFGEVRAETAAVDHLFRYVGRELDEESGLYYHRNRYYDADTGRYLSVDPSGFAGGDVNLYRYVGNNPVNLTDPYGLRSKSFFEDIRAFEESAPALKAKFDLIEKARAEGASAERLKGLNDLIDAGIRDGSLKAVDIERVAAGQGPPSGGSEIVAARDNDNRLIFVNEKALTPADLKRLANEEAVRLSSGDLADGKASDVTRRAIEDATDRLERLNADQRVREQDAALGDALHRGEAADNPQRASEIAAVAAARRRQDEMDHLAALDRLRDEVGAGVFQAAEQNLFVRDTLRAEAKIREFERNTLQPIGIVAAEVGISLIPVVGTAYEAFLISKLDPCEKQFERNVRLGMLTVFAPLDFLFIGGIFRNLRAPSRLSRVGGQTLRPQLPDGPGPVNNIHLPGGLSDNLAGASGQVADALAPQRLVQPLDDLPAADRALLENLNDHAETLIDVVTPAPAIDADALRALGMSDDQVRRMQRAREQIRVDVANQNAPRIIEADLTPEELADLVAPAQGVSKDLADAATEAASDVKTVRQLAGDQTAIDTQAGTLLDARNTAFDTQAPTLIDTDRTFIDNQLSRSIATDKTIVLQPGLNQTQRLPIPTAEMRGNTTQVLPRIDVGRDLSRTAEASVSPANLLDDTVENAAQRLQQKLRPSNLLDAPTKEAAERVRDVIQNNTKSPLVGQAKDAFRDVATTFDDIKQRAFERSFAKEVAADEAFQALSQPSQQTLRDIAQFMGLTVDDSRKLFGGLDDDFLSFVGK